MHCVGASNSFVVESLAVPRHLNALKAPWCEGQGHHASSARPVRSKIPGGQEVAEMKAVSMPIVTLGGSDSWR